MSNSHDNDTVSVSNLERGLPPADRRAARAARHDHPTPAETAAAQGTASSPPEHFIVLANATHLRIYAEEPGLNGNHGSLRTVESLDLPAGKQHYTDRDTDQAGRFGSSVSRGRGVGGSIDERLPMLEEHQRRIATELARHIDQFLLQHPRAHWDFAAGPLINHAVLEALSEPVRRRLGRSLSKDIVNQPLAEMKSHFQAVVTA